MKTQWLKLGLLALFTSIFAAAPLAANGQVTLISTGAVWKYLDDGSDQGTDWIVPGFDDSTWLSGPAELGLGDGGEATTNASGHITYYYRHTFNVADASSITNVRARLRRDDGAVVYLNGVEVFRSNMPTGAVDYLTLAPAVASDDGTVFYPSLIAPARLINENNVMAVEVHQQSTTSSDISFALELVANPLPLITINGPTNNQVIRGDIVSITGTAVPAGQSVTRIEAFAGIAKVGESTNADFAILWQSVPPGNYTLRAKVTDSSGLVVTSAPVNVTVEALPASMLIARRSTGWRYHKLNQDLFTTQPTWAQPEYVDTGWAGPSPGPLGENPDAPAGDAIATAINTGPSSSRYPVVFYRRSFTVSGASAYQGLIVRLQCDDYAVVFINGQQVVNDGVPEPLTFNFTGGSATGSETDYAEYSVPATTLRNGLNVVAVANYQQAAGSSDLQFDLELEGMIDTTPPAVLAISPPEGSIRTELSSINVIFDNAVVGVGATDLLINSESATSIVTNNPRDYTFSFPQPATGAVQVAFAPNHGITDTSPLANAFGGLAWSYTLNPNATTRPDVVLSEFLADNDNGIRDEDGQRSDWVELLNHGPLEANLDGWFLTDTPTNLTKWRIPAVAMQNNAYLIIWCSSKNRSNLNAPLHTNFRLQREAGGYLALVDPQTNVVSSFTYPEQSADVSYGRDRVDPNLTGYLATPTPAAQNITSGPGILGEPVFSLASGVYTNASLTVMISNTNGLGTIRYTVNATLPSSNSTIYAGPITLSANSTIKARVYPPAATNLLPSAVGARNLIFLDSTTANFSSRWPLMIISTEGRSIPESLPPGSTNRAKGSLVVIDTVQGQSSVRGQPEVHELAEFEIYGQTSAGFAKRPIRIEIQDAIGNDLDKEVLGMPADSDWRLRNPYNDKTYLNDFLGYELWEKMGHYSVRRRFVELFLDTGGNRMAYPGDYYGVMVLCETIKVNKDRVDIPAITPYNTNLTVTDGGFVIKRDKASTGDLNFNSPGGTGFSGIPLRLHEPNVQSMRKVPLTAGESSFPGAGYTTAGTNQMNYLRNFLGTMESAMYAANWTTRTGTNHYSYYLDPVAFADQMLHVEITKQIDGYRLSDYFTKGRDGRIGPGPVWDWNLAFGNADYLKGGMTNGWYYEDCGETDHPWARRLITGSSSSTTTSGDPNFVQLVADRWAMFRTNVLNGTNLLRQIDELATKMSESAARDLYGKYRSGLIGVDTWPNPDGTAEGRDVDFVHPTNYLGAIETIAPTNYNGSIIGQMKKWMLGRYLWMDSQFVPIPTFSLPPGLVTPGTTVRLTPPAGGTVYYTLNGTDPRLSGGGVAPGAQFSTSPVNIPINSNARIFARAQRAGSWKGTWSGSNANTFFTTVPAVRITEVMFHPAPPPLGDTNDADNFEFVEVKNISAAAVNLNGYQLAGGIQFVFGDLTLQAGQSAVVVRDLAAFASRYNTNGMRIAGTFAGNLANDRDRLVLYDNLLVPIHDFQYEDRWHPTTDGIGFSLVIANENGTLPNWSQQTGWRASSSIGGSPSALEPAPPPRPPVVINEALSHSDTNFIPGLVDTIEINNPTASPADISGWFLSDEFDTPKKFVIPSPTILQPGAFVVFTENDFNPTNPPSPTGFGLSAKGEEVWLFSSDGTNLTGYAHGFDFGPAPAGVTFGRYLISTGQERFVLQSTNTLGATNAGPQVGPIVISEISYHPADIVVNGIGYNNTADEFIELQNITSEPVPLYDPNFPTNVWRLRDAVDYSFPSNSVVPPGSFLLVVNFDPNANTNATADFRARNFVPGGVPLFGPWIGDLDNESDSVELARPDVPDPTNSTTPGFVAYYLADRVNYSDEAPWPPAADGLGMSLQRIAPAGYGNDPGNWVAVAPAPGANYVPGGTLPAITSQPGNRLVVAGTDVILSATVSGTPPLRFQWRFNGLTLPGATGESLTLTNIQFSQAGVYNVFVYNSAGSVLGTNFTISVRTGLRITAQPANRFVEVGRTTNFTVAAIGTGTLRYQWQLNGVNIPTGTSTTLTVANIQTVNEGTYRCLVSDDFETIASQEVTLAIVTRPTYTQHPLSQTAVAGGTVTFTASASGTTPIGFRWRRSSVTLTNLISGFIMTMPSYSSLTLTNLRVTDSTNYNVVVTNIAGTALGGGSGGLSSNAVLTVLADTDGDGLPDVWESARPGFSATDPSDGARDDDGDGMSNTAEYIAGTDCLDPTNYLRVDFAATSFATLSFIAVSNRSYTVQYSDGLNSPNWQKLGDVLARNVNRTEAVPDPNARTNRFYRLVTPIQR